MSTRKIFEKMILFLMKNDVFVLKEVKLKDIYHRFPKWRKWSDSRYNYDNLKNNIVKGGYDPEEHEYIQLTRDNIVLNGHHRKEVLTELYGGEYDLTVQKHILPYWLFFLMYLLMGCVIVPMLFIERLMRIVKTIYVTFKKIFFKKKK